jgi:mono/diheme cytochrome c family protein
MRRLLPLLAFAALLAGCGGRTVSPTAETVVGTLPTTTQATASATGNAAAGKALFASKGCVGCHTFQPAGSHSSTGPDLDKLATYAQQANKGSLPEFTAASIKDPGSYVQPGYSNIMPSFGLSDQQIADLTAYLTKG